MSDEKDEKAIRDALSEKLGLDFCSEEDLIKEQKVAQLEKDMPEFKGEIKGTFDNSVTVTAVGHAISMSEIIERCSEARAKMGKNNPNNFLLFLCSNAIRQLVDKLDSYEHKQKVH